MGSTVAFFLLTSVAALPTEWLAPDPELLLKLEQTLVERLERSEAMSVALIRAQNQLGERLQSGASLCSTDEGNALVTRTRILGSALRDAAQSVRAAWMRVQAVAKEKTVSPLLDRAAKARLQALSARVEDAEKQFLQSAQWQRYVVDPRAAPCSPQLQPAPGFSSATPSVERRVAIIAFGDGFVCPGRRAAAGVIVLEHGRACYGGEDCACTPEPVLPGAVLGPAGVDAASSADAGST